MNTVVNHKSKDIFQDFPPEGRKQPGKTRAQGDNGSKCDCLGVESGASNRGAPRGAERNGKQTWSMTPASTTSKERFTRPSNEVDTTPKSRLRPS